MLKTLTVAGVGSVEAGSTSYHKTAPVPAECWKHWHFQTQQSRPKFACDKMKNAKSTHYHLAGWRAPGLASLLGSQAPALVPKPGQKKLLRVTPKEWRAATNFSVAFRKKQKCGKPAEWKGNTFWRKRAINTHSQAAAPLDLRQAN